MLAKVTATVLVRAILLRGCFELFKKDLRVVYAPVVQDHSIR
jgi:hypothetical protein